MSNHNTDLKHLSDEALDDVLSKTSDNAAKLDQYSRVSFWVGTILAGAAIVGAMGLAATPITAAVAATAGALGLASFGGSIHTFRQCCKQMERNEQALSVRQARDTAREITNVMSHDEPEQATSQSKGKHWQEFIEQSREQTADQGHAIH